MMGSRREEVKGRDCCFIHTSHALSVISYLSLSVTWNVINSQGKLTAGNMLTLIPHPDFISLQPWRRIRGSKIWEA